MRLMTYNLFNGGAGRVDPLAEVIRLAEADVVMVQEAMDETLLHQLADRLKMDRFVAGNPRNPQGATAILSRLPIVEAVNHSPLDRRITRSMFHAVVQAGAQRLPIIGLHLHARETLADEQVRLGELPALLDIAQAFHQRPHVIAGDFNTNSPAQVIEVAALRPKVRERIAPQNDEHPREVIRTMLGRGYVDAHAQGRTPEQFGRSFTTAYPATRVDFVLLSLEAAPLLRSCEVFTPEMAKYASDHFPVVAELAV
jgi:endonuclease/exonuclease/phosphatase family metal-dependent hydrolase